MLKQESCIVAKPSCSYRRGVRGRWGRGGGVGWLGGFVEASLLYGLLDAG